MIFSLLLCVFLRVPWWLYMLWALCALLKLSYNAAKKEK